MKTFLIVLFTLLILSAGILLMNTLRVSSRQIPVEPLQKISLDENKICSHLSKAISFKTVAEHSSDSVFIQFHEFLNLQFPGVFQKLEKLFFDEKSSSLILKWTGKNSSLKPILFLAHQDVVPVDDLKKWQFYPFAEKMDQEFIYGRGSLDDKSGVLGILEACEILISRGFQPERSVYFAFGHDEETGGTNGAKNIAVYFSTRKIEFETILDEGGSIVKDVVPGVQSAVALIGIAEKGYATVELSTVSEGGHSSMPPPQTSAGIISAAVVKLEKNQFKTKLTPVSRSMFDYLASEMDFGSRLAFTNTWLMEKIILNKMSKKNSSNAAIRTTTAVTLMNAGKKDNVLPVNASAIVNFRILPGETTAGVMKHVQDVVDDERVKIELKGHYNEPSEIADTASASFRNLNKTIREIFPQTLVAPYLLVGATDSKHFFSLSKNIFRFLPIYLEPEDLKRIHGTDERIHKSNYLDMVRFYVRYLETSSKLN